LSDNLTDRREFVNVFTILTIENASSQSFREAAVMSADVFRDDALRDKSILVAGGGSGRASQRDKAQRAAGG